MNTTNEHNKPDGPANKMTPPPHRSRLRLIAVVAAWLAVGWRVAHILGGDAVNRAPALMAPRTFGLGFYAASHILVRHLDVLLILFVISFVVSRLHRRAVAKHGRASAPLSLPHRFLRLIPRAAGWVLLFSVAMLALSALSMAMLRFGSLLYGAATLFLGIDAWRGGRLSAASLKNGRLIPLAILWAAFIVESVLGSGFRLWTPTAVYACLAALFAGAAVAILRRTKTLRCSPVSAASATLAAFLVFNLFNVWLQSKSVREETAFRSVRCDNVRAQPFLKPLTPQRNYYAADYMPSRQKLFITRMECKCVYATSPGSLNLKKIALPGVPNYMADDGADRLFVLLGDAMDDGKIDIVSIDAARERIVSRLSLPSTLYSIAFSSSLNRIYVSTLNQPLLFEIDARSLRVRRRAKLPWTAAYIYALRNDDPANRIYATDFVMFGNLFVINRRTLLPEKTIPFRTPLSGVDVSTRFNRIYAAEFFGRGINVIDRSTLRPVARISSGFTLRGLAVDDRRSLLYASTMSDRKLWIHSLPSGRLLRVVPIGVNARSIFVAPDGRVFIASGCGTFELDVEKALREKSPAH